MSPNKRIVLNIVATYGRSLYALAIGLVCGRWTLMALGESDYGLVGVVGGLTAFISFFNGVMASGVGRFYALSVGAEERDPVAGLDACHKWFTTAVIVHAVLPVFLVSIGYPLGEWAVRHFLTIPSDRVEAFVWVWRLSCLNCFIGMASVPYHAMYVAHQEIAELTVYSFATTTLNAMFMCYAVNHPGDWLVRYAIWGTLICVTPSLIITLRAFVKYRECRFRWQYMNCLHRIKEMLSYCGWLTMGAVALLMKGQGVVILVNKFFGPRVNAAMAIGNTLSSNCTQLSGSLEGAFWPAIMSAYGKGDMSLFRSLTSRVNKFATCLVILFAVPLSMEVDEVLALWLKKVPAYAGGLCVCFLAVLIIDKLSIGHCAAINAVGKVAGYQVAVSSMLLLTVPIGWGLLALGCTVYSVAYAMIGTAVGATIVRVLLARRIAGLSARAWLVHTVLPLLFSVVVSGLFACLPRFSLSSSFVRVVLTTLFFLCAYAVCVCFLVMDSAERNFARTRLRQKFARKADS